MGETVYLNGRLVPAGTATIPASDRGFLFGDGLFETMRAYGGRIHLLRRHLVPRIPPALEESDRDGFHPLGQQGACRSLQLRLVPPG